MWLFWIVWACVCAPASLRACTHTHTHARLPAYVPTCTPVFVCPCRSIKFCSHSCRLVSAWLWSVCLPLNLQPLLLFHSLSSFLPTFSSASPCSASLCWLQLYLFFFTACLFCFVFLFFFFLPLSTDALTISPSELSGPLFFSFALLSISRFTLAGFHLSALPTTLPWFFFFFLFRFWLWLEKYRRRETRVVKHDAEVIHWKKSFFFLAVGLQRWIQGIRG